MSLLERVFAKGIVGRVFDREMDKHGNLIDPDFIDILFSESGEMRQNFETFPGSPRIDYSLQHSISSAPIITSH